MILWYYHMHHTTHVAFSVEYRGVRYDLNILALQNPYKNHMSWNMYPSWTGFLTVLLHVGLYALGMFKLRVCCVGQGEGGGGGVEMSAPTTTSMFIDICPCQVSTLRGSIRVARGISPLCPIQLQIV